MNNLEYLRHKHRMTLEEVGKHIGTSRQYVHQMEKGDTPISNRFKVALAELFDVTIEELEQAK